MNFQLTIEPINNIQSDLQIVLVAQKDLEHTFVQDKELLKKAGFKGGQDETALFLERDRLYVGVEKITADNLRTATATAMRTLVSTSYNHVSIASYLDETKSADMIRAMVEGFELGAYRFEKYKSDKRSNPVTDITISLEEYHGEILDIEACAHALHLGQITSEATNFTRDIVNTTPDDCYPDVMAHIAKDLAEEYDLHCKILKGNEIRKEKMGALLAVARASRHRPRVIHLAHKPKNPKAVISLVGKGLTYDSGGLSLKPSDFMVTMKADKSGGSAVLGIMKAVAQMNLPVEVHGFVGAVENMIGGDAYKPDDVLISKSGKTIEVRNTDAEGRLVLADVLAYAQQEVKADYLFDFATLTGACVVGVGNYTSGVMGNCDTPKNLVTEAAQCSGELVTKLDFNRYLKKTLKSEIADICNISNTRYGGAITASMFLAEFIDEDHRDKWAHIDIAGPAFVEHVWGENPHGASGAGVRLMLRLLENLSK
ncbi:MAG: leucyl aminopeptidase [Campylobacterales bacterium]|nr:leucyl aminopeptidase [Campylobacterales bacterium]